MRAIYLDSNSTTRPAEEVIAAMHDALRDCWANPSSVHRAGQAARQRLELARESVCTLIGCKDRDFLFTSGGTEAANLAIVGSVEQNRDKSVVVTSRLEHSAVRETAEPLSDRGVEVAWLLNDSNGVVDLNALRESLRSRATEIAVVSVMYANNETGVIQPIESIGALCREFGVRFHCDATQWVGKMPIDADQLPVDMFSFAAHKFHGPKGVGGLYIRRGVRVSRQIIGGPQERQRRGGTENVPGIIGIGMAAELAKKWLQTNERDRLERMRNDFEKRICDSVDDASVNGMNAPRLWNTSNIAFARLEAEAILLMLSERGVYASAGAACSSGSLDPSPVLLAMGIPPEKAHGSVRFSLSRETTQGELDQAAEIMIEVIAKLRRSMTVV